MSDIDTKQLYTQLGLNKTQTTETKANDKLGQAEFLELMTAQLKFQDPLKPMENGDFLAQMAQFGTVNGINELNTAFNSMSAAFQSNQALQASTMVGRQVLSPGNQAQLDATGSVHGAVELDQPASQVIVTVHDNLGQVVRRVDLGRQSAGLIEFDWNGLDEAGNRAAQGAYRISAEVHQGDGISAGAVMTAALVESVTVGNAGQELTLTVSGKGDVGLNQIRKIM